MTNLDMTDKEALSILNRLIAFWKDKSKYEDVFIEKLGSLNFTINDYYYSFADDASFINISVDDTKTSIGIQQSEAVVKKIVELNSLVTKVFNERQREAKRNFIKNMNI